MKIKRKRIRRNVERGIIGFILLIMASFVYMKSEYDILVVAKKQPSTKNASTVHHAPIHKQSIKGSPLAASIAKKEKEEKSKKIVYLTFDDGPSADAAELLDTLDKYGAKATFFMLAPNIERHAEVVQRMVQEGYGLGLHGVTHDAHQFYHSKTSALHEMQEAQAVLEKIGGVKTNLVRTPYGSVPFLLDSYREVMESSGFQIWDWDIDSEDWDKGSAFVSHVINRIDLLAKAGEHPIILMHDRGQTIKYLPTLLKWLNDNHYETGNLDGCMEAFHFNCNNRCRPIDGDQKAKL
ncbi:polysaccharide deacetylase family protein [Neobacillus mesonae]|uniref:NodB homology domain-containing protein n=1 Tax=Neobacillus mesonae TaxID=1193713 RepID=A0A3Q9QUN7_9BACI|nr:polysaccharide deacetylase family protein [Neobacillus mesonae]AZU61986.1 hypothetical protein CHR53_12235 [Neobacillus mesonae]